MKNILLSIAALLLAFPSLTWGNQYKELSLEEKSKRADLVVIGAVSEISKLNCPKGSKCARLELNSTLKGAGKNSVIVLFDGPIAEMNPVCCEIGATYLFFLRKIDGNVYESINGPYGIYPMAKAHQSSP